MIKDVILKFKDVGGYDNEVYMTDIIVMSHHAGEGVIVVETSNHGTFAFIREDARVDLLTADREYYLDTIAMCNLAVELELIEGE